jgi:hypothetical protein
MSRRRSGLNDTSPDTERVHLDLLRKAGETRRLQICLALSDEVMDLSWKALRAAEPGASERALKVRFVAIHYGQDLANRLMQSTTG